MDRKMTRQKRERDKKGEEEKSRVSERNR